MKTMTTAEVASLEWQKHLIECAICKKAVERIKELRHAEEAS